MSAGANEQLAEQVRNALRVVIDPELGWDIVELGLVYGVAVADGGVARVTMTTTTRGCPAASYLEQGARHCVENVPGVARAEIVMTYEPGWSPEMMGPDAKRHFGVVAEADG